MAQTLPLVSIAMTTFNGVDFVAQQLASIAAQTYEPVEIIVSDDGSTDGTLEVLESLQQKYNFKLFTRSAPLGVNANVAFVLQCCHGDLIAIADQDDIWEADKIKILVDSIGDYDAIFSNSSFIDHDGKPLHGTLIEQLLNGASPCVGTDPLFFIFKNIVSGHALLFRRKLLGSIIPSVGDYYYDQQLAIAASLGNGISYLDRPLVRHRQHSANTCGQHYSKKNKARTPRRARADRMACELRVGTQYVLKVSSQMGINTACVHRIRKLSHLLDAVGMFDRISLFYALLRNQSSLFPYLSWGERLKWVFRVVTALPNTKIVNS